MKKLWRLKGLGKILCVLMLLTALLAGCQEIDSEEILSDLIQNEILGDESWDSEFSDDGYLDDDSYKETVLDEDGSYTSKEDVAAYLHQYNHLPQNFIRKSEAKKLGWESSEGNLHEVAPGKSIGGDKFGNYEGLLPKADGRKYYECDINFEGGYRGAERIIYSNDGLIYYTADHYKTFELLYGEE